MDILRELYPQLYKKETINLILLPWCIAAFLCGNFSDVLQKAFVSFPVLPRHIRGHCLRRLLNLTMKYLLGHKSTPESNEKG